MDQYIPLRCNNKQRRQSPWITGRTVKKLRQRRDYRKFPSTKKYNTYKELRNLVTVLIREDRATYQRKLIRNFKNCPKRFYGYMRNLQTAKSAVSQLKTSTGSLKTSDREAAETLCQSFHKVFTSESGTVLLDTECSTENIVVSFDSKTVLQKLLKLNVDKSPGPDGLHPAVLKHCANAVLEPLSLIFQKSYNTGNLPEDWKLANVSPLFKKGPKSDPGNYRPVSLTSVACKIMESIIKDSLVSSLADKLSCYQHGFMKGRSLMSNKLIGFIIGLD